MENIGQTLQCVDFTAPHPPYVVGDIAAFSQEEAAALVKAGVARAVSRKDADKLHAQRDRSVPPIEADKTLTLVRFVLSSAPYIVGDVAGFSRAVAETYVLAGAAEIIQKDDIPESEPLPEHAPAERDPKGGTEIAPPRPDLVPVRFVESRRVENQSYAVGEVAAFPVDVALKLLDEAVAVDPKSDPAAPRPKASTSTQVVDENVEVHGADDRDPDWREKQAAAAEEKAAAEKAAADKAAAAAAGKKSK